MEHDGDDPYATPTSIEGTASKRGARADTTASRYQELEVLGKGGMGEVVAARDSMLGREVAIKRMLDASPSLEQQQRFLREARIQGVLDHPAIPPVHELAYDDNGRPYFVMKRLVGTTLSKILGALATGDADALC
jgi:serine/threonine-protein kinase